VNEAVPSTALRLIEFIDASPSPFHAAETAAARLEQVGFRRGAPGSAEARDGSRLGVHVHGGSLVAWLAPAAVTPATTFRLIGAHTDSPNLRIKPNPDLQRAGLAQLGVEVYGGALLNSWLDRDLGLSGRVAVRTDAGPVLRLFRLDEPLLRIPQLAIHLDREINDKGLLLNKQQHLAPMWAIAGDDAPRFVDVVAAAACVAGADVLGWDAMVHPLEPSRVVGLRQEFVSAPRIDNLLSCFAAVEALATTVGAADRAAPPDAVSVVVLFDHEEVGSTSDRGAAGAFLSSVLERIWVGSGGDRAGFLAALAGGCCLSADGAHATNPNYADRHEPDHRIALNAGPVLKLNANLRYATDAASSARWVDACQRSGVALQRFVNRTDLACGSTIGPLTAAALGMPTVDVGAPQLAMHSARELCGVADIAALHNAMVAYLQ
jgi:aspartyl aminopeptidase